MNIQPDLLLESFHSTTLDAMAQAGLQQRVETKFLLPEAHLQQLLAQLTQDYYCLEIEGRRSFGYTTNYFDTAGFRLYLDHHNGYTKRLKIRSRRYDDTGECFFETKQKYNLHHTRKERKRIDTLRQQLVQEDYQLINHPHLVNEEVHWKLTNTFRRITLCNRAFTERITIDRCIDLFNDRSTISLNKLLVVEVKQAHYFNGSIAIRALKNTGAIGASFSKYAIGSALLYPALKHNLFKPILTLLKKHHYA